MATGSYTKTTWASSTIVSAETLNHAETQYDEAKYLIDNHSHDSDYYTKDASDLKFFHSGNMGSGSGADADLLDGSHAAAIMTASLPQKAIVAWSGIESAIPTGWAACNGQTVSGITTPDLRDRFVLGAGSTYSVRSTGGSATISSNSGTVTIGGYTLTTADIPAHYHDWSDSYGVGSGSSASGSGIRSHDTTTRSGTTGSIGNGDAHDHSSKSVSTTSFDNRPKYYALYYIEKVA